MASSRVVFLKALVEKARFSMCEIVWPAMRGTNQV